MLMTFCYFSIPTLPQRNTRWNPISPKNLQYLDIGNDPTVGPIAGVSLKMVPGVPFPERMRLFESLFPVTGPYQIYY